MNKPLVSIVTPCYNGESYLSRFFDSILNQTYTNLEVVLINDGSTDRTENIVNQYRSLFDKKGITLIYEFQKNAGQAAALNRGLKLFTGEYVTWIDSDDEIMPDFIKKKVDFLEKHSEYVYCYGKAIAVDEDKPDKIVDVFERRKKNGRYAFFEDILMVRDVFFSGYLVKTAAFEKVILNREIYTGAGGQNAQILLPLGWYYGEPGYVDESVYKYFVRTESHSHSQNSSEKIIQQLYNYEQILLHTLERISDKDVLKYNDIVKGYYAKLRFGNAIDTKKAELIKKHYLELKKTGTATKKDFALYIKYTNRVIRNILHIG